MQPRIFTSAILPALLALASLSLAAVAQTPRYKLTDLGAGRSFSQAYTISNNGLIAGVAVTPEGTQHAVIWYLDHLFDVASGSPSGLNSLAFAVNDSLEFAGQAETGALDPNRENFCVYNTNLACLPFVWREGVLTQLPTLGGYNGTVGNINRRGVVSGFAETAKVDHDCLKTVAASGTGPQVLDFEAVLWKRDGTVHELHPLAVDTVGVAMWVNDHGVAVGTSGVCSNTLYPPFVVGPHAVLWEKDGSVTDLGNLGGTANPALLIGNAAISINNREQVTGISAVPGSLAHHAFLWTRATGMRDLGTLPGDLVSAGLAINKHGDVVGVSNPGGVLAPTARAVLWQDGKVLNLNDLLPANAPLYLLTAFGINDHGEIVGMGITQAGELHAYLATPTRERNKHEEGDDNDNE